MALERYDPLRNYRFLVEIEGVASAGFQTCTGPKMKSDVTEYREGGDVSSPRMLPGQTKFDPITLGRGYTDNNDLYEWASTVFKIGEPPVKEFRRNLSIILQDRAGNEVKRWRIFNAWVSEYNGGDMDAMSSDVLIEEIVIQHEGFEVA